MKKKLKKTALILEIWGLTCFFNDHREIFFEFLKIKKKNYRKHKFVLISETVTDRAKRTKFWDHIYCQWSQHNMFDPDCIFSQIVILAEYLSKFCSGCIFVQNSIQAAYLGNFSLLLHILCKFYCTYLFVQFFI